MTCCAAGYRVVAVWQGGERVAAVWWAYSDHGCVVLCCKKVGVEEVCDGDVWLLLFCVVCESEG
jgi:hypothetical protein